MRKIFGALFVLTLISCSKGSGSGVVVPTLPSTAGLTLQGSCRYKDGTKLVACIELFTNTVEDTGNLQTTCEGDPVPLNVTFSLNRCNQTTQLRTCGITVDQPPAKAVVLMNFYNDYETYVYADEACATLDQALIGTSFD